MKKSYIYLILIILLFISCDYGYKSGEDLLCAWSEENCFGMTCTFEFYEDGTGLKVFRSPSKEGIFSNNSEYSFEYVVVPGDEEGSKLVLTNIKKNGEYIDKEYDDERYNYYFNVEKNNLYLNQYTPTDNNIWYTYQKINYKYKGNYKDKFSFKER